MSALPSIPPPETSAEDTRVSALAQLRNDLVRRFPGAVASPLSSPSSAHPTHPNLARENHREGNAARLAELRRASFLWLEVAVGQGGLAWLAAWTSLRLADDPLSRPALWIDTHCTLTPGDLLDLEGRLVVIRPADAHEAHVAADIALRAGSFSLVALEMHRALHPTPLARLSRLANARRVGSGSNGGSESDSHTPLIVWGEPPPFLAPPSGTARTSFSDAVSALLADPRLIRDLSRDGAPLHPLTQRTELDRHEQQPDFSFRAPHTTDRLRPLDRAADRRPSPPPPRPARERVGLGRSDLVDSPPDSDTPHERERHDAAPFPHARSRSQSQPPR